MDWHFNTILLQHCKSSYSWWQYLFLWKTFAITYILVVKKVLTCITNSGIECSKQQCTSKPKLKHLKVSLILSRCVFPHSVLWEALLVPLDESSESKYKEIISASNICYSLSLFLSYTIYLCSCRRSSLAPFLSARTVSTSTFDLREDVLLSLNCNLPEALAKTFPCPTHIFFYLLTSEKLCGH